MSMERWNPFREIETMRQAMDRWFDERGLNNLGLSSGGSQTLSLAVDLHETDKGYELTASLPGVKSENIEINVDRDQVTIRGRTEQTEERREGNYLYRERHMGSYQRSIRLPEQVNSEQVEATLENGVLRLTLPRLQQTIQRKIKVRSGADNSSQQLSTGTNSSPSDSEERKSNSMQEQNAQSQRPEVMNNLSTTQMDELDRHLDENNRDSFNQRANDYGWDSQTTEQVWHYMTHRVSKDEVTRAFETPE